MDTTETYILQCEKATDLQKMWKPKIGDYVLRRFTVFGEPLDSQIWPNKEAKEEVTILHYHSDITQYWHGVTLDGESRTVEFPDSGEMVKATSICLFRQDQLQEMLWPEAYQRSIPFAMVRALQEWCEIHPIAQFSSMEQLWLSFIMHKKHEVVWNSEKGKWI